MVLGFFHLVLKDKKLIRNENQCVHEPLVRTVNLTFVHLH